MTPLALHARRPRRPLATRLGLAAGWLALALAGCGVYSFSGATIPDHLQSVAVPIVEDRATGGPAGLDQQLTDALVERFADRSRLALVEDEEDADAVVRATIERYEVAPVSIAIGEETGRSEAVLNRVQLAVRVVIEDRVRSDDLLDRTFTATDDYDPQAGLAGEADAVATAVEQVARDAFTAATSDF